ncbi:hypothetical protein [Sneathiella sp.]|uniref:hypothetical protein n=1 Tax=Sneathiella sp. TaxID=1964365 RepID=UPI002FE0B3EF
MDGATRARKALRIRARNTNVNERTLLATDYLNHFNEALMLAEMVTDVPEMLEDFLGWQPRCYVDHFRQSSLADRDLAIAAYPLSPPEYRAPFDEITRGLDTEIRALQRHFSAAAAQRREATEERITEQCRAIRHLIDRAGAIINGYSPDKAPPRAEADSETAFGEEAINALFD